MTTTETPPGINYETLLPWFSEHVAPVKSLALEQVERVHVGPRGIDGDRRFVLAGADGVMLTQREVGALALVSAHYAAAANTLALRFPGGRTVAAPIELGEPASSAFYTEYQSPGRAVAGPFDAALSDYAGQPVRLVRTDDPGAAFDDGAVTIASLASVDAVTHAAGGAPVDRRRFRQSFYISGTDAHGEDGWIGRDITIGEALLHVEKRDSRCVMTQVNPDTGEQDIQTLKIIAAYRTDLPKSVYFGVYASVLRPGAVAVGDTITVGAAPASTVR